MAMAADSEDGSTFAALLLLTIDVAHAMLWQLARRR
jgi:hypothetical protein